MTLATVAEATGVSRMTVSNAYNRPDQLSPALREKILEAARTMGYSGPNPVARTLSRGEAGSIGLVLDYALTTAFTDPAQVQFLHGVAAGCEERAVGLALVPRIEGRDEALVKSALVDGFILYCTPEQDARFATVRDRRLPYVLVDYEPHLHTRTVNIDDRGAARQMGEHIAKLGHRSIGIVVPYKHLEEIAPAPDRLSERYIGDERLAGWRAGLEAGGIDWGTVEMASAPGAVRDTGRIAAGHLLDRADRPTAIIALSDVLALGVIEAAKERGISVPGDLSVTGFDDVPEAAISTPPLTTIWQPHMKKGSEAVRLLLEGDEDESVHLPTELIVRASTAPAPERSRP
jgi:DNA-binding LacI/PurR family transcriptional regulator